MIGNELGKVVRKKRLKGQLLDPSTIHIFNLEVVQYHVIVSRMTLALDPYDSNNLGTGHRTRQTDTGTDAI
jgi:hypothetical protein